MTLSDNERRLRGFNLTIRQRLEQAEARIPKLNDLIDRVAAVDLINDVALLGDVILQRPYVADANRQDSSQVLQAALLVPGGLGATVWDLDDRERLRNDPEGMAREARSRFIPFEELSSGEKALLMFYLAPLVMQLSRLLLPMVESDDHPPL